VPFCRRRCGYCNFTLLAGRDDLVEAYLEALQKELSSLGRPREVDTLFFGGGTPTHLAAEPLTRLFALVDRWFPRAAGCEVSVEANPEDLDAARAQVLAEAGVNRVSLGAQSFDAEKLRALERAHDADTIREAVARCREFAASVSLDLIFAAPGETLDAWRRDLDDTLALSPDHVSTYGLTYERGTRYWSRLLRGELASADEEVEREMYLTAIDTLTAAGLVHYEVSNFARPDHRCRHNEVYWQGAPYFAAGPGAARYVDGRRETNHRSTTTWIRRVLAGESPVAQSETLPPDDAARERLVFALRRLEGIDLDAFAASTGFQVEQLCGREIEKFIELGMLQQEGRRLRLTRDGLLISDTLWGELLAAAS
jgi:oxygen-independent coproporphyrinogen-3 oxidase